MQRKPAHNQHYATAENPDLYRGDHWPYWIGPTVAPADPRYSERMEQLERVFQSANILRECAQNWVDGLLSEPFAWFLKAEDGTRVSAEDDATAAEAEQKLQRWLDHVAQHAVNADPGASDFPQSDPWSEFVLSLGVLGQGGLRLWQPARFADDPDPIRRIHLHATQSGSLDIDRSKDDGFIDAIAYRAATGIERQTMAGDVVSVADKTSGEAIELDTGGRWLIQHATGESIYTPSVKRLQAALNHALTMMVRNQEVAGFREKVFGNAEYPADSAGNPVSVDSGPGRDLFLYGVPTGDAANPGYAPVSVFQSEPVDNSSLAAAIQVYRSLIYMQFCQGHLLSAGDGTLSGTSRIQMRGQFELSLRGWRKRIESAIASILNIVLRLLEFEGYEVVVELTITTGKLSPEERATILTEYQAGIISKATTLARLGVQDVDAELALLAEEAAEGMARRDIPNDALPDPLGLVGGVGVVVQP